MSYWSTLRRRGLFRQINCRLLNRRPSDLTATQLTPRKKCNRAYGMFQGKCHAVISDIKAARRHFWVWTACEYNTLREEKGRENQSRCPSRRMTQPESQCHGLQVHAHLNPYKSGPKSRRWGEDHAPLSEQDVNPYCPKIHVCRLKKKTQKPTPLISLIFLTLVRYFAWW